LFQCGYFAGCLTKSMVTRGDPWEDLRAMVQDAVAGCFFGRRKAANNSIISCVTKCSPCEEIARRFEPRDTGNIAKFEQTGSPIIGQIETPGHRRMPIPAHRTLKVAAVTGTRGRSRITKACCEN
jgi:hypothetical protein